MQLRGFIYAIVASIFFGSAGIFVKNGNSPSFGPVDILMLQYIIGGITLFFICFFKYREHLKLTKDLVKKFVIQGAILNTGMTAFYYSAFTYLDITIVTMLLFTYPAMVAFLSFFIFKEKISGTKIIAIIGTLIGCTLVLNIFSANFKSMSTKGLIFGILAAVFYALMNIHAEHIVEDIPPLVVTFYTTVFSLLALSIFNFGFYSKLSCITMASFKNASILAVLCEIIPLTLIYAAIKYIGPVSTSVIATLELPASAVLAFFVMHESIAFIQVAGILIVIYCIVLLQRGEKKQSEPESK